MPVAVYFIVCDSIRPDPVNPVRVSVEGLLSQIRAHGSPPFPFIRSFLSVYLVLTDPDPQMTFTIQIVRADTGAVTSRLPPQPASIRGGRDQRVGVLFNLNGCRFPAAGLYWVECWNGGARLARQRLYVVQ